MNVVHKPKADKASWSAFHADQDLAHAKPSVRAPGEDLEEAVKEIDDLS